MPSKRPRPPFCRRPPVDIAGRLTARYGGRDLFELVSDIRREVMGPIVFTTSFGLEDQAMAHAIFTARLAIDIVTLDTGRLFPETHQVWAETEQRYGQRIRALSPEHRSVEAWVARHGIDGFRAAVEARQGCCSVRKVEPLRRALAQASAWITGLCAEQSADRAVTAYAALDPAYHLLKVNPLLDWTRERVLDFVRQHDIPYNRLHDRGFLSIGCAPCTRAVAAGEPERAGRWWWEQDEKKECGCIATMRLPPASSAGSRWQPQQIRNNAVHGVISAGRADEAFAGAKNAPHRLSQLAQLEAESIYILREAIAESDNPVLLYSIGKDSAVLLHLALKAFHPGKPPFPLLHIDTTWKFREMIAFRDRRARELGLDLIVHTNADGLARGINPVTHGPELHTDVMKTQALRQALDAHGFDLALGGARRDEEKSRAKERVFSLRNAHHRWDPKRQRPEPWRLYNARKRRGESLRVFPLSNWTELDIWLYIHQERIPVVPLYFAAPRPVVERGGTLIVVDDERLPLAPGETPQIRNVRFRTLGCYPLTGAVESEAASLPEIIRETVEASFSERRDRVIDHDGAASMERKKQEGYF